MFAFTLRKTGSMHEQPGDLWWKSVITFIRKGSCVYAISVPLGFSFFLGLRSICAPTFHPHIKAIHHRDQTHCVSPRQPDLLVGSFCVCEFYDWGQGPGTHRYISDKVSLTTAFSPALRALTFRAAWPTRIARPHVNVTFKENNWVPAHVAASQLLQASGTGKHNSIHPRSSQ